MIPRHFKLPGSRHSIALVVFCFALGDAARTETEPIPRLITALQSEDPQARAEAAAALMEMGPAATEATPALIRALKDDARVSNWAIAALSAIGSPAVPSLLWALADEHPSVRIGAADALACMQQGSIDARRVVPPLLRAVNDPIPGVRIEALRALAAVQQTASVPVLVQRLKADRNADVRRAAAGVLGDLGPAAKDAVPALIQALEDPDSFIARQVRVLPVGLHGWYGVQEAACEALAQIGSAAVPSLVELVKDPDRKRQTKALWILARMGSPANAAAPVLAEKLQDEDQGIRVLTAFSLRLIGPQAQQAVPALTKALADRSSEVRVSAATALKAIDASNRDAIPVIVKELRDKKSDARQEAVSALAAVGGGEMEAVDALIEALIDTDEVVVTEAVHGLRDIGPSVLPALLKDLKDGSSPAIRGMAAHRLTYVRDEEQDEEITVPALIDALQDAEESVRCFAAHALGAHGQKAKSAMPALTKALTDPGATVREEAAKALQQIRGPK